MDLSAAAYARHLKALLPPGAAWDLEAASTTSKLLAAIAEELARIDARAGAVIDESDPRTTSELLAEWERVYGLPEPCAPANQSTIERRAALVARVIARGGGQTPEYYISVAAALGFTITVTEFRPFTVGSPVSDPILGTKWAYAWQVNAPLDTVIYFTVRSSVADALASWGNEVLECVLTRLKPAHTSLIFSYT